MLLLLKPCRLTAPVPVSQTDSATWTEADPVAGPADSDSIGWFYLGHANKRPKRNTLLSSWTAGVPPQPGDERRLDDL